MPITLDKRIAFIDEVERQEVRVTVLEAKKRQFVRQGHYAAERAIYVYILKHNVLHAIKTPYLQVKQLVYCDEDLSLRHLENLSHSLFALDREARVNEI